MEMTGRIKTVPPIVPLMSEKMAKALFGYVIMMKLVSNYIDLIKLKIGFYFIFFNDKFYFYIIIADVF